MGEVFGKVSLAKARLPEQQDRRELHGLVAGNSECEEFLEVVDHRAEIGRGVVEIVDRAVGGGLDDETRSAEHPHAVVPALQSLVGSGRAVPRRAIDIGDGVDRLQTGNRDHRFHAA